MIGDRLRARVVEAGVAVVLSPAAVVVLAVAGLSHTALAQSSLSGGFERDVNRYRWTSTAEISESAGAWDVSFSNAFRSDAFLLFDDRLSFRDENRFSWMARRPLRASANGGAAGVAAAGGTGASGTVLVARGQADWFSLSRVFHQNAWAGVKFRPGVGQVDWWVEPAAGLAVDSRPGFGADPRTVPIRTDAGPAAAIRLGVPESDVGGYRVALEGLGQVQRFAPRAGSQLRLRARSTRSFNRTDVRMIAEASRVRRDSYQSASFLNRPETTARQDETVESTVSDTVFVRLEVDSHVARDWSVGAMLDASTNSRTVETLRAPEDALFFDSDFGRRTVDGTLTTAWQRATSSVRLLVRAGAEVETRRLVNVDDLPPAQASQKQNLLRQADYDRGFAALQLTGRFPLTDRLMVRFDGSANILQHDTPDVNPDDRDELLYNALAGLRYNLAEGLAVTMEVFGSRFHTVYLKAERSAENNVQRVIRWRPSVDWRPGPGTRIGFSSEVRATYTVDDFLLPGRRPNDQSAREMRYSADVEHDFGAGIRVIGTGSTSDLQLGRFLDDSFAEIPFDTLRTYSGWVRLAAGRRVQAEIGLRAFVRTDYNRSVRVRYRPEPDAPETSISRAGRTRIDQIGPTTALTWPMRGGGYVRFDGWVTVQRVSNTLYGGLPEGREDIIRRAARRGERTLIPNLSVTMLWNL